MKNNTIYKIINGKGENRRLDRRYVFLGLFIFIMVATFSFLLTRNANNVNAADLSQFKAGNIISDAVMRNYTSMSEAEIQNFLKSKNACNKTASSVSGAKAVNPGNDNGVTYNYQYSYGGKTYHYHVENGKFVCLADEKFNGETAAHIIYQAAQDYKINPQVLIVLLEKEQGLVSDLWPNTNYQYRSATGYGCPDTAACDSKYYGIKNQIRQAASLFNTVLSGGWTNYPLGWNTIRYSPNAACGSSQVYIENLATSALYRYTPYQPNEGALKAYTGSANCGAYGNRNFFIFFNDWFGSTQTVAVKTPSITFTSDGIFTLQASNGKYLVPEKNASGAKLILTADANSDNKYKFTKDGDYYVIKHIKSGLVLDVYNADVNKGIVQLYQPDNTYAQKWRISASGNGYVIHSAILDNVVLNAADASTNLKITEGKATEILTISDTSQAVIKDGTYFLATTGNKAMDVDGGRTTNGTRIITNHMAYNSRQQFSITRGKDGLYTIKQLASGRVLDVAAAGTANGSAIQLYDSNNTCAQKWVAEKSGSGYRFLSACSAKAIDVPGANVSSINQQLQIYTANGTNAQVWKLETINPLADGEYTIKSAVGANMVMDISGGAPTSRNGTNIQNWSSNGTTAQKFKVAYNTSKKAYSIINPYASDKVLDVSGASTANGANVQVWASNLTCAQLWHLHPYGDGTYSIISSCSDKVLDVSGANTYNGANIQIYTANGTNAQKWTFSKN